MSFCSRIDLEAADSPSPHEPGLNIQGGLKYVNYNQPPVCDYLESVQ